MWERVERSIANVKSKLNDHQRKTRRFYYTHMPRYTMTRSCCVSPIRARSNRVDQGGVLSSALKIWPRSSLARGVQQIHRPIKRLHWSPYRWVPDSGTWIWFHEVPLVPLGTIRAEVGWRRSNASGGRLVGRCGVLDLVAGRQEKVSRKYLEGAATYSGRPK
jgi:hypothetical protein